MIYIILRKWKDNDYASLSSFQIMHLWVMCYFSFSLIVTIINFEGYSVIDYCVYHLFMSVSSVSFIKAIVTFIIKSVYLKNIFLFQ